MSGEKKTFSEASGENWSEEREKLLQRKISELGLKLEGTRLEKLVECLYQELEVAGIRFKPKVYLSEEWGCPEGIPVIGIPFYLADEKLSRIADEILEGIEGETDEEILSYLRHEAGHAFNYAYKLYETEEWHELFGPYSRPYREDYQPNPFSRNFVRHLPGWYAQKHPDEDFAETFAVWLTPDSNWREFYKDWGCYKKLLYVDRIVQKLGQTEPLVTADKYDITKEDLNYSIADHYKMFLSETVEVPAYFDGDLKDIFERKVPQNAKDEWQSAHQFLTRYRRQIVGNITYWTGLNETVVRSLINHFIDRCKLLGLWVKLSKSSEVLMEITAYATTLCMNKLYKGDFIIK
ncbi:MAG TPA: putative zinc-binding metallopeptidase [Candidatus Limnocylindrales bacterium]|nr:putative zinc-binding metallopeptidase [Candidatus Limnocylindrales bacterium]